MENKNNKNYKIKKSCINGMGLFAVRDFKKGEKIYSYRKGRIILKNEIRKLTKEEKQYLDKIEKDKFEIIEPPGCFINHSCNPNVYEKERIGYALRNIKKGEELTINYGKIAYIEEPFFCKCGSKNCRKIVKGKK